MELERLITALSDPAAYRGQEAVEGVEVHQTHISVVFLAGAHAYKIKKPVDLGFVDYRTLDRRHQLCEGEVHLNRRLAPSVYLGVVPITLDDGRLRVEGDGEVIEWAVKMERLSEAARFGEQVDRGAVGVDQVEALAARIAAFHAQADGGPGVAAFGRFEVVARNATETLEQSAAHVGKTLSLAVFERLKGLTGAALAGLRDLIESRADRGIPRDGHGDLRLDHIYLFPDRRPPADMVAIDCIEFAERFRCADPISDMAFLVMDLIYRGRADLARAFAEAYFRASGDAEGRALLPFYTAYRSAIRGKVEGIELDEREVPEAEKSKALWRARGHWLLALGALETPGRRPCLVLVGGVPGSGKSTLARGLTERAGFDTIRSDLVRKELAGDRAGAAGFEQGIYSPESTDRTYAECLRRAEGLLFEGRRVLIDASFRTEAHRRLALDTARRWGVPALLLVCRAGPEVRRARLERRRGDASDADWKTSRQIAERWEPPGPETGRALRPIDSGGSPDEVLGLALDVLRREGLEGEM